MKWIIILSSCMTLIPKLIKCHPIYNPDLAINSEWMKSHSEIVYPQLHLADSTSEEFSNLGNHYVLVLRTSSGTFYAELRPNEKLTKTNKLEENLSDSCHYSGDVLSHGGGVVAISACKSLNKMTGLIMVQNGAFSLRPANYPEDSKYTWTNSTNSKLEPHILNQVDISPSAYCGVHHDAAVRVQVDRDNDRGRSRRSIEEKPKVIETAVYIDSPMYKEFTVGRGKSEKELADAVLAIMNQVQIIYDYESMKIKFKIVVVKIEFLADELAPIDGDIDGYLDHFCSWNSRIKPPVTSEDYWDHAILLTGHDLYKMKDGQKNKEALGLTWINGMCRPQHSCTLNKDIGFQAAFVIAHEMGHSLGMHHDGLGNDCDAKTYVMSPNTGPGRITWSTCSVEYLYHFFLRGDGTCLEDDDSYGNPSVQRRYDPLLPGLHYDLFEQCKMAFGKHYIPRIKSYAPYNDVCRELWCISGYWAVMAHPALEGTPCDAGKLCIQGKCEKDTSNGFARSPLGVYVRRGAAEFIQKLKYHSGTIKP